VTRRSRHPRSSRRRSNVARLLLPAVAVAAVVLLVGCSDDDAASTTSAPPTTGTTAAPSTTTTSTVATGDGASPLVRAVCAGAATVTEAGTVEAPEITEASGLAAGRRRPGVWWVHNDSGDTARIFAIDDTGRLMATVNVSGAEARDWEDIAVGPPVDSRTGAATVYVGDIGDNALRTGDTASARSSVPVYRLTEPAIDASAAAPSTLTARAERLNLRYPDGPHDAEALLVDPRTGDLVIITKDWARTGSSAVYRAPAGLRSGSTTTLERVGEVKIPAGTLITGADVSPDGSFVVVRSYGDVRVYRRPTGQPVWSAFAEQPCTGPTPVELQGESVGVAADGASYLTLSEGRRPVLHRTGA
jgi:hypothetical protein